MKRRGRISPADVKFDVSAPKLTQDDFGFHHVSFTVIRLTDAFIRLFTDSYNTELSFPHSTSALNSELGL